MAEDTCPDPTQCFKNVRDSSININKCIKDILTQSNEKVQLLNEFDRFCNTEDIPLNQNGQRVWKQALIDEAANFFGALVKKRIDSATSKGPRGDFLFPPGDTKNGRRYPWANFIQKWRSACKLKITEINLFRNYIIPSVLNDKYQKYINICNSLKNIRSVLCKGDGPECFNDFTGWLAIVDCVKDMGYTQSMYWEDGFLTDLGHKFASRLCFGIDILEVEPFQNDPIWGEILYAPDGCRGATTLIVRDRTADFLRKSFAWKTKQEQREKYKEMAKLAAEAYKTAMLEAIPMIQEIIQISQDNRKLLTNNVFENLKSVIEHNELEIWALEQFFANFTKHQGLPRTAIEDFACMCTMEYLWGGGGIPPICQMGNEPGGKIWFDNAANDVCVQKFRDTLHPLGEQGPMGSHMISKLESPTMDLATATQAVKAKGGAQCASAKAINFVDGGDKWVITYRFDPCLLWYPQLYMVDKCTVEQVHIIMKKMVELLNKTRTPNCGQSILHAWVFNEMPGTAPEGEFFGWGDTIDGGSCKYSWPNETNNPNRDGVNPGDPEVQPVALPSNCSIYPNYMGQGDRYEFYLNAYFISLFWKHYGASDTNAIADNVSKKLIAVTNSLTACPPEIIECDT